MTGLKLVVRIFSPSPFILWEDKATNEIQSNPILHPPKPGLS